MTNYGFTDFHSHILPCADHGSESVEVSLKQVQLAKKAGISTIVATSHFYPLAEELSSFLKRRELAYNQLKAVLPADSPKILLGAEVQLTSNLYAIPGIENLCIEGTDTLLIELPNALIGPDLFDCLDKLCTRFQVVIAHPDRYTSKIVKKLADLGYMFQVNVSAFRSRSGRKSMMPYVENGTVWALGSDIHGANKIYYKNYNCAVKKLGEHNYVIQRKMYDLVKGKEEF